MRPFFTLITPVYNIEHLISATIESALSQSFTDWEMICIDDGSPDNAGAICDEYAQKDSRIRVIHKQNAGLAAARNTGIDNARGKYFIILEGSDLFYDENTLRDIHADLTSNPVDIYFARLQDKMEGTGEVTNVQSPYCVDGLWNNGGEALICRLYDNNDILALSSPVNKVFRVQFVKDFGLRFCEGIYHDDDEWIPRAIAHSDKSYFTNRVVYNALTWDGCFGGNVSEKGLTRKAVDKMFIAERCCKYFEDHFPDNNDLQKKMYTYYARMYNEGIVALNLVKDPALRQSISRSIKEHRKVFKYMRVCDSTNLKLLAILKRILGIPATIRIIKKRYR